MKLPSPRLVPVTSLLALLILASVTPQSAVSQARSADAEVPAPTDLLYPDGRPVLLNPPASVFKPRPASEVAPHRYLGTDWAPIIDATWGPSPLTVPQMLSVFDNFWIQIDQRFACFQDLDVDWTALRDRYRPEIAGGVSRGRFAAIMGHLSLALQESHTRIADLGVTLFTFPDPGVPLFYIGNWGDDRHFAAGLTPLPDSSLLVYEAIPSHPLGLVPGDIVLGYEGIPWKQLYRELLAAELPIGSVWWWGSSSSSLTHSMLMSAGINWHLFSTIDVVKYATGDTVHLSVAPLIGLNFQYDWTEQLPVPGVQKPNYLGAGDKVSWGIVDGTQIGYIYVREWTGNAGVEFFNAVDSLMTDYDTKGLIVDFRTNYGGNMFLSYDALELLYDEEVWTIGFVERCSIDDHLGLCNSPSGPPSSYVIHGDDVGTYYDHPIAVLVGPGAISSGDQVANLFKFHPRARFFGKSTSTAFNAPVTHTVGFPDWTARYARAEAYLVSNPTEYMTHDEFAVDDPVWFERDDVAQGIDTVVEAAKAWINSFLVSVDEPPVTAPFVVYRNTPNPFSAATTIRVQLSARSRVSMKVYDASGRLIRTLLDEEKPEGEHRVVWNRTTDVGGTAPAGVYFYQLDVAGQRAGGQMVVLD